MARVTSLPTRALAAHKGLSRLPRCSLVPAYVTDEMLGRACRAHLRGHKPKFLAEMMGTSEAVVVRIIDTREWRAACGVFREDVRDGNAIVATVIASVAMEKTLERLERGDPVVTESGVRYVPVSARDAAAIAVKFSERADVLQRQKDGIAEPSTVDSIRTLLDVADVLQAAGEAVVKRMVERDVTPSSEAIDARQAALGDTTIEGEAVEVPDA